MNADTEEKALAELKPDQRKMLEAGVEAAWGKAGLALMPISLRD